MKIHRDIIFTSEWMEEEILDVSGGHYWQVVFKHNDKYYKFGNYIDDPEYGEVNCTEVVPVEKTVIVYEEK